MRNLFSILLPFLISGCGGYVGNFVGYNPLEPQEAILLKGSRVLAVPYPQPNFTQDTSYTASITCMNGVCIPNRITQYENLNKLSAMAGASDPALLARKALMKDLKSKFGAIEVTSSTIALNSTLGTRLSPTKLKNMFPNADYLLDVAVQEWQIQYGYYKFYLSMRLLSNKNETVVSSDDCQFKTNKPLRDFDKVNGLKIIAYALQQSGPQCLQSFKNHWTSSTLILPSSQIKPIKSPIKP